MENRHPGKCYRCLKAVPPGDGFAHKNYGRWWVQHKTCHDTGRRLDEDGNVVTGISQYETYVEQVPIFDPEYIALGNAERLARMKRNATEAGEKGRRARKWLRDNVA